MDEIEKSSDAFETPANRLAENLPDDLVFKLKDKPKTFTLPLTKWLEKRVKTPYGGDNIRMERQFDTYANRNLWRVFSGVSGVSGVATASSLEKKSSGLYVSGKRDGNDPGDPGDPEDPAQEDEEPGRDRAQNGSGSHLNGTSPSEQFAGVARVSSDTSEKALTGLNISASELSSLVLCCTCLDENVETPAQFLGPEDVLYCKRHAQGWESGAQAEHVDPSGSGDFSDCEEDLDAFSSRLSQVCQLLQTEPVVALDLETTGLSCRSDRVISITIGKPGNITILDMRPYYSLSQEREKHWKQQLSTLFQTAIPKTC